MPRTIGTETEFGIATPSAPQFSPVVSSTHAVVGFAEQGQAKLVRWDYSGEHPLTDVKDGDRKRYDHRPQPDPAALGVANALCFNGARLYVDHAHPEYSSPECGDIHKAMIYDKAGEHVLYQSVLHLAEMHKNGRSVLEGDQPCPPIKVYKNNVDGKGASYGSHENYQYLRSTNFDELAQGLIPLFVTRQVLVGAGRVGLGTEGQEPGFQISQRADYIETDISLETTFHRGIINTRDEPHADPELFGRLHVIIGDANMSQTSILLKLGITSMVLDAIETGIDFSDLKLKNPVDEVRNVSRDLSLTHVLELADGRFLTALDILAEYRDRVTASNASERRVLQCWDEAMALLNHDPLSAAHLLDWVAKYKLVSSFLTRGLDMSDPRVALIDLQYSDVDPSTSLYHALVRRGQMRELVAPEEIRAAATTPPPLTRAYARGRIVQEFSEHIVSANWQNLVLAVDKNSSASSETFEVDLRRADSWSQYSSAAHIDKAVSAGDVTYLR